MILDKMEQGSDRDLDFNLGDLRDDFLTHICTENKAFFRSQQIDEPDLTFDSRKEIASEILRKSHSKFLQRFGMNMKKEHLRYFEHQSYNPSEQQDISDSLKHISWNINHHGSIIRNRRYAALVKLIEDKKYFSEGEMRSRDPLLFEQLVGQYQSPAEKRANRRPDPKKDTLVDVLLEGIDHDFNREIERVQRVAEESMFHNDEDSQQSAISSHSQNSDDDDSESDRQQWGNFDEPHSSARDPIPKAKKRSADLITAGERDLLKEEFLGIMYSNFLSGKDGEFYDYTAVDTNEDYDDTLETEQDFEDKYFDEDSQELSAQRINFSDAEPITNNDDSEDELDVYMKHLEKNLKRQENGFEEEFDE